MRHACVIGVDVGGTNTDAVILTNENRVFCWTKRPTTPDVTTGVLDTILSVLKECKKKSKLKKKYPNDCIREIHMLNIYQPPPCNLKYRWRAYVNIHQPKKTVALNYQECHFFFTLLKLNKNTSAPAVFSVLGGADSVLLRQINIGTTHFVNAVVQRSPNLSPVAVIRLSKSPCTESVAPFSDFPKALKKLVNGGYDYVDGGYEFNGKEISPINTQQILDVVEKFIQRNVRNFVVCGVFSSTKHDQEQQAREIIKSKYPEISVTCSYELGQLGLLERENAAILNESLKSLCKLAIGNLEQRLTDIGIKCPLYFTQNDGAICSIGTALNYPVFTFASGPTNSMRGAAFISGLNDAIVVDIGGTSTDIGVIINGFPRQAGARVMVGEVPTNFRMPNTLSLALGGGSIIRGCTSDNFTIGPDSVGYRLNKEALSFNGDTLTATDIAVLAGLVPDLNINEKLQKFNIQNDLVMQILDKFKTIVENGIDQMKTEATLVPVAVVGGGSILLDPKRNLQGSSETLIVEHYSVANAIGAALCQISGQVDAVAAVDPEQPDKRINSIREIKKKAIDNAISNGASPANVEIVEFDEIPLAYLPGNAIRMKCRAVGPAAILNDDTLCQNIDLKNFHVDQNQIVTDQNEHSKNKVALEIDKDSIDGMISESCVNLERDPWNLSNLDVEYICAGAAILGCGGGGSPHVGKLRILNVIEKFGKHPVVVSHDWLLKNGFANTFPVYSIGFMGAPGVLIEKIPAGVESLNAIRLLHAITCHTEKIDLTNVQSDLGCKFADNVPLVSTNLKIEKNQFAVMTPEIGGFNSTEALAVSALFGVYCVDCDEMGRAFPELQMSTKLINGISPFPSVQTNEKGRQTVTLSAESCKAVENLNRKICIENGCSSAFALGSVELDKIATTCVTGSIRRAWSLGKSVFEAKHRKSSPVAAVLENETGKLICNGKLIDVQRKIISGFSRGHFILQGLNEFSDKTYKVEFQNENLLVLLNDECAATVPDLICLMDTESGEGITTEDLRYGLRASLLMLKPSPLLTTDKALKVVGPEAFGYANFQYKPTF